MFGEFPADLLEQFKRDYAERQAMALGYPYPSFTDKADMPCNKPKAEAHGDKSNVVKACEGGKEKLIRFGQRGVKGSPKKEGESESYRKRREAFNARHEGYIKKGGKMSGSYWAKKTKW